MCGIFALLNNDNGSQQYFTKDFISTEFMKGVGRGPEYSSINTVAQQVIFGFHRLAINGLNPTSHQPIVNGNISMICNGEIYNYKELYKQLDIEPHTQSDCEVIIHLYKRFGIEQTLKLIDGVFAFVLLDYDINSETAKIYVARDPFGVRPLYFLHPQSQKSGQDQMYGFASELKCLNEFYKNLENYNIKHISPGTYTMFEKQFIVSANWELSKESQMYHIPGVITNQYFVLDYENELNHWVPIIQNQLVQAVEKRCMTTERPIACLLSGGLDSSLITALVNDFHKRNELPTLETYSIGLEGSVDLQYASIVSDYLGTKHNEIVLTEADFLNVIPEVIEKIESYDTTTVRASIGNYLLGKYIKEHSDAKVIFNGDGSDELTGGYLYFHKAPNAVEFDLECRRLLRDIHLYDVLRSDKSISSHGLEPRTPFLDREWVQTYLSIPAEVRFHTKHNKCEKHLLRYAFSKYLNYEDTSILPDAVLWRTKEAFSDGVSKTSRSLYEIIQEHVSKNYAPMILNKSYGHNEPKTLEQEYYRELFESSYCGLGKIVPYFWMPRFVEASDASARTLSIYTSVQNTSTQ